MKEIKDYIDNFYETDDLLKLAKCVSINLNNDTNRSDLFYVAICNKILDLLKNSHLRDKYRIEIDVRCASLIEKLFKTYVKPDTFVITSSHDHDATTSRLGGNKRYIVNLFRLQDKQERSKVFEEIITAFKESKCTNVFCIMVGTTPQSAVMIDQVFFIELKNKLIRNNIPHLMFLDDCQGLLMIERNYEIFDGFLATGHVLSCLFPNVGLLFTKLSQRIGYINKQTLFDIYDKLKIIDKYKDKALDFNRLISKYFESTLKEVGFTKYDNEVPHQFAVALPNTKVIKKLDYDFLPYGIRFNSIDTSDNFVRIRYFEAIVLDSDFFVEGLSKLKKSLNHLSKRKEMGINNIEYSNESRDPNLDLFLPLEKRKLNNKLSTILSAEELQYIRKNMLHAQQVRMK